jgi:hypothetical protein
MAMPLDGVVELIGDYLRRDLSPAQVVELAERFDTDPEFGRIATFYLLLGGAEIAIKPYATDN